MNARTSSRQEKESTLFSLPWRLGVLAFILLLSTRATAQNKKLIEYGWDVPDPAFVHAHLKEMEQRPFDGVVIRCPKPADPGKRGRSLGWLVFGKEQFQPQDYEHLLPDLRAIQSNKLTDNFIQVICKPGDVDWHDDAGWQSICHNVAVMAHLAKEAHCVGLMIDPEEYGKEPLWSVNIWRDIQTGKASAQDYNKLAGQRGQQFMRAINKEFPNIQILFLFGPTLTYDFARVHELNYALLRPFIKGMCDAADTGTQITDGYEQSYMYRTATSFAVARQEQHEALRDPHLLVGFGLWIDNGSNKQPWQLHDFNLNYFQPETWQNAIHYSLKTSDKYVWVYDQALDWWQNKNVPPEYVDAMVHGRTAPADVSIEQPANEFTKHAAPRNGDECFADLLLTHDLVYDVPAAGWTFQAEGSTKTYPIEIKKFWEEQGIDYDGYTTCSTKFSIDTLPNDRPILLALGAIDESAEIFLNGQLIGKHDEGEHGWDQLFLFDVTKTIHGGKNSLSVRVLDRAGPGGIWKSIKIITPKKVADFVPSMQHKKMIAYGADWPNTAYVRDHVEQMEKLPFDGIVIGVSKTTEPQEHQGTLGITAWSREQIQPSDYEHAIKELRDTNFKKFTDNFIQVETLPGDINFFDDDGWASICHNMAALARVAKQGGCVGLEFDPEEYSNEHVWTYSAWPKEKQRGKSEVEFMQQAQLRGQQMMKAINKEFPNIKILCLFGPSFSRISTKYQLLAPFIEGMCQAADQGSQIIDGFEQSYGYRTLAAFARGRDDMLRSRDLFTDKTAFDKHMKSAFGICLDEDAGKAPPFASDVATINRRFPGKQSAVYGALTYSDEYVWTWHGNYNGWEEGLPYEAALIDGRKYPGTSLVEQLSAKSPAVLLATKAADLKDHDDDHLSANEQIIYRIPNESWQIQFPYSAAKYPIEIGKFWEEQGFDYDGAATYIKNFDLRSVPLNKKVYLHFGAVDESVIGVTLNGKNVGSHDVGERGWNQPFELDVTGHLLPGNNVLKIEVSDRSGPGGIWKGIELVTKK